jgi:hypothetical protein
MMFDFSFLAAAGWHAAAGRQRPIAMFRPRVAV